MPAVTIKADPHIIQKYAPQIDAFKQALDSLSAETDHPMTSDSRLKAIPEDLEQQRDSIRKFVETLKPIQKNIQERGSKLGPVPKDGAPPEAEDLAKERAAINARIAAYDSLIKNADLLLVRAGQIIDRTSSLRRQRFSRQLLSPADNFYSASLWRNAITSIGWQTWLVLTSLVSLVSGLLADKLGYVALAFLLPIVAAVGAHRLSRPSGHRLETAPAAQDAVADRSKIGARTALAIARKAGPVLVGLLVSYLLTIRMGLLSESSIDLFVSILAASGYSCLLFVGSHQMLASADREARFFAIESGPAWRVQLLVALMVLAWLVDHILAGIDQQFASPLALVILRSLVSAVTIAALLLLLIRVRLRSDGFGARSQYKGWPKPVVLLVAGLAGFILLACLLGYVSLGRFMAIQVVVTGGILALMYLLHLLADHISSVSLESPVEGDAGGEATAATVASPGRSLRLMASLVFDILILVVGIPAILLQWGFDWAEVKGWLSAAFFGFQIGDYTISIQNVLVAIGILAAGIFVTRGVQQWFIKKSDSGLRTDTGIRDSIRAGLGYGGVILSLLAAVSYLGINFSNLAIIAGALSVGVGFGLQTVVNNFVSGLIVLIERPIKVGDWISVGEADGLVRKISVRATELETLDKQSIIVPNSEFVGKPVTNWMYNERIGRISIAVGVSYASDVDEVERVLMEAAKSNKYVLRYPGPSVIFNDFGDSSLDFLLRVYISDMEHKIPASSSIRFSIWRALKKAGIEIPFPQRDIHVKDIQEVVRFGKHVRAEAAS